MLLTVAHLIALDGLATGEAAVKATHVLKEDEERYGIYRELELQRLVLLKPPRSYQLTQAGREALSLLKAMREAGLYPSLDRLKHKWRFLGSDILAALHAARRNKGHVGPLTEEMLSTRGLTKNVHDTLERRSFVSLNQHGEAWDDFAARYRPRLEIDGDLADAIRRMHPGYTARPDAQMSAEQLELLEVMDLLTWSVPEGDTYALTDLGQAVYDALHDGGYSPLDESILETLALLVDKGSAALTAEQVVNLQLLGYVDGDETLSPAGQAAMRAYSLLQSELPEYAHTFAITEPEVELLATIQQITESANRPQLSPDKETLHRVLVDRMTKRYQALVGRYGRTLKENSAKKRKALALIEQTKDHDEWFNTFWDIEELIIGLEAFDLLRPEREGTKTVYRLTSQGLKVVEEQAGNARDITATAVKALTVAATRYRAPGDLWIDQARGENLIGTGGITKSGRFYADLAEHCVRVPALTREEAELLENLPETEKASCALATSDHESSDEEKRDWALEKLEARGLIERLVDCQIVRTEVGQLLTKVVSGAMHLGHPVTPTIVRLLAAIRQVGTLHTRERKVRIQPHQWEEVERLMGLGPQEFREVITVARMGQYIGKASLTEAGLDLLAAQEQLNKELDGVASESHYVMSR